MNPIDHQLQRLLKAASRAPEPKASLPPSLEQRVMAQLRRQRVPQVEVAFLRLCRWALGFAAVFALMAFIWSSQGSRETGSEALTLANSSIQLSLLP